MASDARPSNGMLVALNKPMNESMMDGDGAWNNRTAAPGRAVLALRTLEQFQVPARACTKRTTE